MGKVTLRDIAAHAGVGTATAERVLNGRGGVSATLTAKVVRAVRALDYHHRIPAQHRGIIRVEVMLVRPETTYYSRLNRAFERIAASLDPSIAVHRTFLRENDPAGVARHIADPKIQRSALIVVAPSHPAVLAELKRQGEAGVVVIQLTTQLTSELPYVGIDNYAAGRTAGFYMNSLLGNRAGEIIALCHSGAYETHKQRIRGFSDYLREHQNAGQTFARILMSLDEEKLARRLLHEAIRDEAPVIGLYSAGGDNAPIASALADLPARDLVWVGHELTEGTDRLLRDGTMAIAIDQAPESQARRALDLALTRLGLIDIEIDPSPIRFLTVTAQNI